MEWLCKYDKYFARIFLTECQLWIDINLSYSLLTEERQRNVRQPFSPPVSLVPSPPSPPSIQTQPPPVTPLPPPTSAEEESSVFENKGFENELSVTSLAANWNFASLTRTFAKSYVTGHHRLCLPQWYCPCLWEILSATAFKLQTFFFYIKWNRHTFTSHILNIMQLFESNSEICDKR